MQRLFRIVLASPGDVAAEREATDRVVRELNRSIAPHIDFEIRLDA
jgi:hypothetical protein